MSEVTRDQALSMIGKLWAGRAGEEVFNLFENGDYQAAYELASAKVEEQEQFRAADERHDMKVHVSGHTLDDLDTQYITVFFPDLGNVTITYEKRPGSTEKRPVISVDFNIRNIDVIDMYGGDRDIR